MPSLPPLKIPGVNRIPKRLADGTVAVYHYAFRGGGPLFWVSPRDGKEGSPEYHQAWKDACDAISSKPRIQGTIHDLVDKYLDSPQFKGKAASTQRNYRLYALKFQEKFGTAKVAILTNPKFSGLVEEWRDQWEANSRASDYAMTTVRRIANWAVKRRYITSHALAGESHYRANRADKIWLEQDVQKFLSIAPEHAKRVLIVALSTGMRANELVQISRTHLKTIDGEQVVQIRTSKSRMLRTATVPVLPELQRVIDETPSDRMHLLVNALGRPATKEWASKIVLKYSRLAGVTPGLHLHDTRGTSVSYLVGVGADLGELAEVFGWSPKYAQSMLDAYRAANPRAAINLAKKIRERRSRDKNAQ